eukprot:comp24433_c0_seq1/m.60280 comp24433_c0_seq1/g.60280  ORF comp24433_c0_seq1/g.60280 comp24433_c0_seq1/m.60280 type:complete len:696 (+) comp24433_c0_seq1:3-2090(+)
MAALDWRAWTALLVFLAVCLMVIVSAASDLRVPVPGFLFRHKPGSAPERRRTVPLPFWLWPILGTFVFLFAGILSVGDLWTILKGDERIQPFGLLIIFNFLAYMCISVDASGILKYLALRMIRAANGSARRLFLLTFALSSVMTLFTSNDIVIMTLTPLVMHGVLSSNIDPMPHLIALFFAANILSAAFIVGNPTNVIVGEAMKMTFVGYLQRMIIPSLVACFSCILVLYLVFRRSLSHRFTPPSVDPRSALLDIPGAWYQSAVLLTTLAFFAFGGFLGLRIWHISLASGLASLIYNLFRLPFYIPAGMRALEPATPRHIAGSFHEEHHELELEHIDIEHGSRSSAPQTHHNGSHSEKDSKASATHHTGDSHHYHHHQQQQQHSHHNDDHSSEDFRPEHTDDHRRSDNHHNHHGHGSHASDSHGQSHGKSNNSNNHHKSSVQTSNSQFSEVDLHASSHPQATAAASLPTSHEIGTASDGHDLHGNLADEETPMMHWLHGHAPGAGRLIERINDERIRRLVRPPDVTAGKLVSLSNTLMALSFPIIPFVCGMFAIVGTLGSTGWIDRIANALLGDYFVDSVIANSLLSILFTVLACNLLNNQPATILITRVLLSPDFETRVGPASYRAIMFNAILGSNLGANFTVIGALAGVLFVSLLKKGGIHMSFVTFSKYGFLIMPLVCIASAITIGIECVLW